MSKVQRNDGAHKTAKDETGTKKLNGMFRIRGGPIETPHLESEFGMSYDENGRPVPKFVYTTQEAYERIGDLSTEILHRTLVERYGMNKIPLHLSCQDVDNAPGAARNPAVASGPAAVSGRIYRPDRPPRRVARFP